jgi:hypothetical protein
MFRLSMSDNLRFQLEQEGYQNYAPTQTFRRPKDAIDNNYLIAAQRETFEESLKNLDSGSLCSRYSSYVSDLKLIRRDLGEANKRFLQNLAKEESVEVQKTQYMRTIQRRADGLTLTVSENELLDATTPELMLDYLAEHRARREKSQQEKTRLADLIESMESKASNLRGKYGASMILEDGQGYKRKFTSAAPGVEQPSKRPQSEVALSLVRRYTTDMILKLDFEKGIELIKEYRDSFQATHDMYTLYNMISCNMESSKQTMDRLGMAKMIFEGLVKERQVDFNRNLSIIMSVAENAKEMKLPALKSRRDKLEAVKKTKEIKPQPKRQSFEKNPRKGNYTRGKGRSRGRGRSDWSRPYPPQGYKTEYPPRKFEDNKAKEPNKSQTDQNFRGRGRGGFRGGRGGQY